MYAYYHDIRSLNHCLKYNLYPSTLKLHTIAPYKVWLPQSLSCETEQNLCKFGFHIKNYMLVAVPAQTSIKLGTFTDFYLWRETIFYWAMTPVAKISTKEILISYKLGKTLSTYRWFWNSPRLWHFYLATVCIYWWEDLSFDYWELYEKHCH